MGVSGSPEGRVGLEGSKSAEEEGEDARLGNPRHRVCATACAYCNAYYSVLWIICACTYYIVCIIHCTLLYIAWLVIQCMAYILPKLGYLFYA